MEFKHTTLNNGLTIIGEINPTAASMAAGFFARTGSRDETPEIAGVSHFLEHMMFKGTARRSADDVNREFDEMGASYNAFTSEENTVYYGAVLPEFQGRLLDLLGDMLRPALRQEDFDVEKNVIQEEIALYEDRPQFRVFENIMSQFFAGHPLGNSILGTRQSIQALKRDQMQAYFDRRYSPGNLTVVGVGNLDWDAFVAKTSQMCSHWTPYDTGRACPAASASASKRVMTDAKVAREHMGICSLAPCNQDADRYAAELAATVVGDSTGSRLYYALVEPAIVDDASMSYEPMDGAGMFLTFLSADPERAGQAVEIAQNELRKFMDEGPTAAELTAAKNKIASSATLKGEVPIGRLKSVGFDWVYRHEYVPLQEQIKTLFAVDAKQIQELARQYDLTKSAVLALGPMEKI